MIMPKAATDDMRHLLHDRVQEVLRDLQWRCEALDLTTDEYVAIVVEILMHRAIEFMALTTKPEADAELAALVFHMLRRARRRQAQAERN
jgi:FixJ family two-component response regulator